MFCTTTKKRMYIVESELHGSFCAFEGPEREGCDARKMHLESNNVFKFVAGIADVSENLFYRANFIVNMVFVVYRFYTTDGYDDANTGEHVVFGSRCDKRAVPCESRTHRGQPDDINIIALAGNKNGKLSRSDGYAR